MHQRRKKREGAHLQELTDIRSQHSEDRVISRLLTKLKKHLPKQLQDVSCVNFCNRDTQESFACCFSVCFFRMKFKVCHHEGQTAWFILLIETSGWRHLLRTLLAAATRSYVLASSYMILTRNWPSISSWASRLENRVNHHSAASERRNTRSKTSSWAAAVFFSSAKRNNSVTRFIYAVSISCLDLYHSNTQWQGKVSTVLLSKLKTARKNPLRGLVGGKKKVKDGTQVCFAQRASSLRKEKWYRTTKWGPDYKNLTMKTGMI